MLITEHPRVKHADGWRDGGESAAPISQVAIDSGFSQHAHFSRAFRAAYAATPMTYRNAIARTVSMSKRLFSREVILPISLSCGLLPTTLAARQAFVKRVRSLLQRLHQLSPAVLASH